MAETDDDVIASWRERVGTSRKRGRVGAAALTVVPAREMTFAAAVRQCQSGYPTRKGTCESG